MLILDWFAYIVIADWAVNSFIREIWGKVIICRVQARIHILSKIIDVSDSKSSDE